MLSDPWYASLVVVHVLVAVISFGALGMSGAYANLVVRSPDPYSSATLLRYFRPSSNLAARLIFLTPVFGGLALAFSGDSSRAYPYIGLAIWVGATGVATASLWPSEKEIQLQLVSESRDTGVLLDAAKRCERAAMVTTVLFVGALVVMIAQPG